MTSLILETRFAMRDRTVLATLLFALTVAAYATTTGLLRVNDQRQEIEALTEQNLAEKQYTLSQQSEPGGAAYYVHHITYQPPSDLAFAASGTREQLAWKHRLRMLALEGQIYEADIGNAGLSHIGQLDFAFVASMLMPLMLILLLYDLDARERREGRYELLVATSAHGRRTLLYRALARAFLLFLVTCVPFIVGAVLSGASLIGSLSISFAVALHLTFWLLVCRFVTGRTIEAPTASVILLGIWLLVVCIVPAGAKMATERFIAVPEGGEILLTQREAVNDAWDLPKTATMVPFVATHPEWADHAEVDRPFEWKWYFAFQQVGDQTVEPLSIALREGIARRDHSMHWLAMLSPSLATERWLNRVANTGLSSHLRYTDCVRDFHAALRKFHYPMLFGEQPYSNDAMLALPEFKPC